MKHRLVEVWLSYFLWLGDASDEFYHTAACLVTPGIWDEWRLNVGSRGELPNMHLEFFWKFGEKGEGCGSHDRVWSCGEMVVSRDVKEDAGADWCV